MQLVAMNDDKHNDVFVAMVTEQAFLKHLKKCLCKNK